MFGSRVLSKIFGKRYKATEVWSGLHDEELYGLFSSLDFIQVIASRMRWVGHMILAMDRRGTYRIFVGKP